jgi:hypothetical protein
MKGRANWSRQDLVKRLQAAEKLQGHTMANDLDDNRGFWSTMAARCGKTSEQCCSKMEGTRTEWNESDPLYLKAHQADLMLDDVRTNFDASAEDDTAPRPRTCTDARYFVITRNCREFAEFLERKRTAGYNPLPSDELMAPAEETEELEPEHSFAVPVSLLQAGENLGIEWYGAKAGQSIKARIYSWTPAVYVYVGLVDAILARENDAKPEAEIQRYRYR